MKKTLAISILFFGLSLSCFAAKPEIWSVNSREDILKGDARGVSIDENGSISLAPELTEVYKTGQPYIWSSVVDAAGNVFLGTGGEGKIFKVDPTGKGSVFADLGEINVTSLVLGKAGEIYAGSSPDGKVYRISATGTIEPYFDPKEKYIWALAVLPDGSLSVATGESGKIFRVRSANASPADTLFFDTSETHIMSLATDQKGNLYAGTDSSGLVLRISPDGKPFALLDSPLREIHQISIGSDDSIYVLALGESVAAKPPEKSPAAPAGETKTVSTEKKKAPAETAKSRYDLAGARTAVYRLTPEGDIGLLWASKTVSGFSIYAHKTGRGVLLGTSDKGRIYDISNDGRETLVQQSDAGQISSIIDGGPSLIVTSSNQGSLFRMGSQTLEEGTYDSAILNAKETATWGRIWWRSTGNVAIQTRSGNTEDAGETWSSWSSILTDPSGSQVSSPRARYLQWRAILKPSATPATLGEVNISYLAQNIAPEVLSIQILPTNVGLAANPAAPIDPNIELSGLDPTDFGLPKGVTSPRRLYQRGATSLQWTSEDRNGDDLVFEVYYKQIGESNFILIRGDLAESFLSIDGQSLADGRYVFKVVAKDRPSNPSQFALIGERISEPVDIDNTPPTVVPVGSPQIMGDNVRVVFDAVDAGSYLTRAEYSVDGNAWLPVFADDGISDSPKERYTITVPTGARGAIAITLRVFDVNANSGNSRVVAKR